MDSFLGPLRHALGRLFVGWRPLQGVGRARVGGVGALLGLLALVAAAGLLGFWWHNLGVLVDEARPVVSLEKVQISLERGETAVIGRRELLQPQRFDAAELRHVAFTRQPDGKVVLRNVARERRLWLDYRNASASFSARWRLTTGDRIQAGAMSLTVEEALPNQLRMQLRSGNAAPVPVTVQRTGASMEIAAGGQPLRTCEPPTPIDRIKQAVTNVITADERGEDRVLHIGGRLTCAVRMERYLAAERLPFRSFTITARGDRFFFAPGDPLDAPRPQAVFFRGGAQIADFQSIAWELDPDGPAVLGSLIIGRTRYDIAIGQEINGRLPLTLTPVSKTYRLAPQEAADLVAAVTTAQVAVSATPPRQPMSRAELGPTLSVMNGAERLLRLAVIGGALALALLSALTSLRARRAVVLGLGHLAQPIIGLALVGLTALLVLAPELAGAVGRPLSFVDEARSVVAAFGLASLMICLGGRFVLPAKFLWLAVIALCMAGSLTLLSLGIDGEKTDFAIHAQKNRLLFIDLVPLFAAVVAATGDRAAEALPESFFAGARFGDHLLRALPSLGILAAFVVWAIVGTETGVAGFQPVEFAKLAFVLVLASVCVSFARIDFFYTQRQYIVWLVVSVLSVATFFLVFTAVPFLKSDYSPILILLATTVVLFFAFLLPAAAKRIGGMAAILLRRADAPQARQKQLGWPRGGALAAVILLLLGLNAALVYAFPKLASRAIAGQWEMPKERGKAMDLLEQAREGSFRKPAERLLTWWDLDHHAQREAGAERLPDVAHRDLGFQLLQSKIALAEMPCSLARLKTGFERLPEAGREALAPLTPFVPDTCALMPAAARQPILETGEAPSDEGARGYSVRDLMRLPVIQNDFIATYMTVRFGLPMALLLVTAEFAAVLSAVLIAVGLLGAQARGSANAAARHGLAITAVGVAALFGLHWSISWGNAIGLLPVMGQPMTFLAAATSHHLLMALPGVGLLLLAGRVAAIRAQRIHREPPAWGVLR
jgi:cell division protein FtsW (lipid II flippase)